MVKITGAKEHKARLRRMRGPRMVRGVTQAIFKSAQDLAVDASVSITAGATSGAGHVPSSPGTPPNADSHVLSNSIHAESVGPLKAEAIADAPYANAQEHGSPSQNLPERPYMRPAAERARRSTLARVQAAANSVISSRA